MTEKTDYVIQLDNGFVVVNCRLSKIKGLFNGTIDALDVSGSLTIEGESVVNVYSKVEGADLE